mmetsp:Transcript_55594/g.133176  ORF Transcript_55594/g.133176 Transcript_55594/m.133176 type:complete len:267 (+) Transcript_55594:1102-1902(+)
MAEELYLTSSTGEELQFCLMRPSADELCPELPLVIAGPPITLDSFGLSARLLSVDGHPPLQPISDDAPPSSTRPAMSASAAAEALERALASGEPLVSLGELPAGDWRDLFQSPRVESALAAASATQLQELAVAGGNETLADLLLHHTLPRLLSRTRASQPHQPPHQPPHQLPQPPQEASGHEPAALPPEMAELLTALLCAGSLRRCAPADFDTSVLRHLRSHRPLGKAATMQASCFYVAARQAEAHERERQFREVDAQCYPPPFDA